MKFDCPSCTQRLEAPDEVFGLDIHCPACDAPIKVPDPRGIRMIEATLKAAPDQGHAAIRLIKHLHLRVSDVIRELSAFGVTLACAVWWQWEAGDIIWGLWASSLFYGVFLYLVIYLVLLMTIYKKDGVLELLRSLTPITMMMVVLLMVCVIFHFAHSIFLMGLFPLEGLSVPNSAFRTLFLRGLSDTHENTVAREVAYIIHIYSRYWPIVLSTIISRLPDFEKVFSNLRHTPPRNPGNRSGDDPVSNNTDGILLFKPIIGVIRMHLLIIAFGILASAGLHRFFIYILLLFYFFPWSSVLFRMCTRAALPAANGSKET